MSGSTLFTLQRDGEEPGHAVPGSTLFTLQRDGEEPGHAEA